MAERARTALTPAPDPEPYVPCNAELYPSRRRVQRLSFMLWPILTSVSASAAGTGINRELLAALETPSTSDRLRLALLRLRQLRQQLRRS